MNALDTFKNDTRGSIAAMFAFALFPILIGVGVAVDYGRASAAKTDLQAALDATALMVVHEVRKAPQAVARTRAQDYFASALDKRYPGTAYSIDIDIDSEGVTVSGSLDVPTTFMRLGQVKSMPIAEMARAAFDTSEIEVVMALDNTGSMKNSGKIEALRGASRSFVTVMETEAKTQKSVKLGLVPFSNHVNLGKVNNGASWLRWDVSNADKNTWNGCVSDRDQPYDISGAPAVPNVHASKHPAVQCSGSLAQVLPMTQSFADVRTRIDTMTASGTTNVTIGIAQGLAALSHDHPLGKGKPFKTTGVKKFLIVLTDGWNTRNRWTSNANDIDARTKLACQAARTNGVLVYTIRVIEGSQALLRDCASSPNHYFDIQNVSQMDAVFKQIAREILSVRLVS
jgi:Flp pilus assembly protein TadG